MAQQKSLVGRGGTVPRRPYGKNGPPLSVVGLGGVVVMEMEQEEANRVVEEAVARGVNYFDVAPSYGDSELRYGPALAPFRKDIFLACKTGERTRERAAAELKQSLQRLRTDHLDLYQLHGLVKMKEDVDVAFGKGGAMEVLIEAKKAGVVRRLGFSAHTEEAALAAMARYDFDSVLFPINFACWLGKGFGPLVVDAAGKKGMALLALKMLARQRWPTGDPHRKRFVNCWYQPTSDPAEAELAMRFTLSQPACGEQGPAVTAAVAPGSLEMFRMAMDLACGRGLEPLSPEEMRRLTDLAKMLTPIMPHG
jgi:aryl-alcohol dehydrogenase-like predicted oxidoreductase